MPSFPEHADHSFESPRALDRLRSGGSAIDERTAARWIWDQPEEAEANRRELRATLAAFQNLSIRRRRSQQQRSAAIRSISAFSAASCAPTRGAQRADLFMFSLPWHRFWSRQATFGPQFDRLLHAGNSPGRPSPSPCRNRVSPNTAAKLRRSSRSQRASPEGSERVVSDELIRVLGLFF
jgi:hypothetical protein